MKVINTFLNLNTEDKLHVYYEILRRIKPREEMAHETSKRNIRKTKQG